ncbi:PREDICTED: protein MIZU-KUSSEI 1 [Tarenaya hassleriana]|uniref:protein MIZU-KUSSEI 1 n=1 Tax=Tarenaya hassleriana TaxID=28532 RepID=UPI00053C5EE1|nr:PREDICTED: protein MIZU-KUSSEI 1 [Tarenaya hassleriana]
MPSSIQSSPFFQMENSAVISLLRHTGNNTVEPKRPKKPSGTVGGVLKMFKLFPMLSSGCKMVNLLSRHRKPLLKDHATTGTIFGYRKGRVFLAIQEDPHCLPMFIIELPILTWALQKEMASETVRIALESETKTSRKKLMEEYVWAVYCNGRKIGYSIRRKHMSEEEIYVTQALRGVSMGAGVLPPPEKEAAADGEMTYMRARFERVIGSKDSEALYMINPEGSGQGTELSIFFVRTR